MILGIYGYQDSGKTTTVERLVSALAEDGLKVASVKHSAHADLGETRGKDSWRHALAGSDPVVLMSPEGSVLRTRTRLPVDGVVGMLMTSFAPDVILIEGLKDGPHPKVSLGDIKPRKGTVMSNPPLEELLAYVRKEVAAERVLATLPGLNCHKCGLDCVSMARAVAEGRRTVQNCKELASVGVSITVGGKRIAAGRFVSDIVDDTVRGMLSSLKGYEQGKDIEIRLKAKGRGARRRPSRRA